MLAIELPITSLSLFDRRYVASDIAKLRAVQLVGRVPDSEASELHSVSPIASLQVHVSGRIVPKRFPEETVMDVGVFYFPVDYGINVAELAKALEDRGFGSLYVPEHTHIPLSRKTPFPGGGDLPKRYAHTHDPFVALAFAAAATKKLKIGTGICLVPQHEPIVTAKAIASLDQLSGGRFVFGIGGGWNVDEMENHGATHKNRFKMMREHVLAMKALWTE